MQTTIIYAHPYDKSFNHAILEKLLAKYATEDLAVIDLYKDGFKPVYTREELALFKTGETLNSLVRHYQEQLAKTDKLIIVSPIWWNNIPAIFKGFFDKVLKMNFAYCPTKTGVKGLLTNITSDEVVTTSTSTTFSLRYFAGNCINSSVKSTLKQIGIQHFSWKHLGGISQSTAKKREKFLATL